MISYLSDVARLFWTGYGLIFFSLLAAVVAFAPSRRAKIVGVLMLVLLAAWPVSLYLEAKREEARLIARNRAMNAQFEKRCKENARVTIKRVVENVDGVFIMKPRKVATGIELQDQFWTGDPYGYSTPEVERPRQLLYDSLLDSRGRPREKSIAGYRFVELPNPKLLKLPDSPPYVRLTGAEPTELGYAKEIETVITARASRFGFDWEDISTPEDRKYWIAGGRTRVIDLETNEVIAERVGYLVDPMQGGRVGGSTWEFSNSKACPKFENEWAKTQEFISQVLISSKGIGYGK